MFSAYYSSLSPSDKHCYSMKLTLILCLQTVMTFFVGGAYLVAENYGFQVAVYGAMK